MDNFLVKIADCTTIDCAKDLLFSQIEIDDKILLALETSIKLHENQFRKSGEPYVVHPILVASITAFVSSDAIMIQAALLHDVVEDTEFGIEEVSSLFGNDVALLVEGLTKIVSIRDEKLASSSSNERLISSALSFRKMLVASIKDVRVLVIKLCDRLHNMMTIDVLRVDKQLRIAEETLVVYAPIAHRLGISKVKNILEDLSFKIIYPDDYHKLENLLSNDNQTLHVKLNDFIFKVEDKLKNAKIDIDDFEIIGRVKHKYSTYLKMHRKGIDIDEVLDLLAIRIITNTPLDCYNVLGALHLSFTPLISRFKDYISLPKENGYQTIHTTLFDEQGIVEVQIRTKQMHELAEYGVAAHWKYKSGASSVKLGWLEGLQYQNESAEEFYELAKGDLFIEDISVFSPKGDHFTLPKGSLALDYAYAVHTHIGSSATSALVNKQKASLLTPLKNGDIVRIITSDEISFHCSWVDSVKTSKAKDGIKNICKDRIKQCDRYSAYNILLGIFDVDKTTMNDTISTLRLANDIHRATSNLDRLKDKIQRISNKLNLNEVKSWEIFKKGYKKPVLKSIELFNIYSNKNIDKIEFDYCCHPKTNDEIVAFYDNGKVLIHHKLCSKAFEMMKNGKEMVYIEWKESKMFKYRLIISLQNQKGSLAFILATLSSLSLNLLSIDLGIKRSDKAEYCQIDIESVEPKKSVLENKISQKHKLIEIISLDDAYNN